ncbi:hypothetical protein TNIN_309791 [Trichonephila inaurata madagascariensis]|uniref:Uncharacterized protein n=1 Tax=Trichonephila inaurata madagascariensis TaxID=2747483 RepID=A0A8X6XLV9_9ARAC|nr:hypothetical protein TNIN_309791 [Trichonephila inaurata madagascariensis]
MSHDFFAHHDLYPELQIRSDIAMSGEGGGERVLINSCTYGWEGQTRRALYHLSECQRRGVRKGDCNLHVLADD